MESSFMLELVPAPTEMMATRRRLRSVVMDSRYMDVDIRM